MAVIMLFDCGPAKARESLQGVGEPARCRRATTLWTEVLPLHTLGAPKARQEGSLGKGGQGERTEPAAPGIAQIKIAGPEGRQKPVARLSVALSGLARCF